MKQRETFQQSRHLAFTKHSIPSASWIPEKLTDMVWDDFSLLLMLMTQICNHYPGWLVKPKKRDDQAFIGNLSTRCKLQDAVLQSVPL